METINLKTWEEFEKELVTIFNYHQDLKRKGKPFYISNLLFRGQQNAKWELKTTLERISDSPMKILNYYEMIYKTKPEIEAFTGRSWNIPSLTAFSGWLAKYFGLGGLFLKPNVREYMAYLRHHGFPSPLLDWTTSSYLAAFFAFREPKIAKGTKKVKCPKCGEVFQSVESCDADKETKENVDPAVAIYAFLELPMGKKRGDISQPFIIPLGAGIRAHPRHFLQKSQYTICCQQKKDGNIYAFHERLFSKNQEGQDLLWKFTIPATERKKVLKILERSNINPYSLFGSEESLMETMAIRKFVINE